jgi:hypothetical protein
MEPFSGVFNSPAAQAIAGAYEFYRYKRVTCHVLPTGGYTAPGSVRVGFVNSPEIGAGAILASSTDRANILLSEQGMKIFPVSNGGTKSLDQNRIRSRQWYACNFSGTTTDLDAYERTVQSTFLYYSQTSGSVLTPYTFSFEVEVEFSGLASSGVNTFLYSVLSGTFTVPFNEEMDVSDPDDIKLLRRNGDVTFYIKKKEAEKPVPKPSQ